MKHTVDIILPEGYEVLDQVVTTEINSNNPLIMILTKKKKGKTFDFYVDEYLRSDYNTTNDMLCNWFEPQQIETIKKRLKYENFKVVPWEVKIGLLKFIAKDIHLPTIEAIKYSNSFMADGYPHMEKLHRLKLICPNGFLHDIQQ